MSGGLREIAAPFVAAAPAGARVRARLRVSAEDEAVLRAAGSHLGSRAGKDLAARCAEGHLSSKGKAASRARRKRALTGESSSRWAGAITRTTEDQVGLAGQNLSAERASLRARARRIEARLAAPAGGKRGRARGYATAAERHARDIRLRRLKARLAVVERQAEAGIVSVTRGGRGLLRKRANLAAAGLAEDQWRAEWEASRWFLTADGEKDKAWGNVTIRWNPDEGWLELKLPAPLSRLANRPHGRYRLSCPVEFTYRGGEVAAQAATGAIRYDITFTPASGRWHVDASWKAAPGPVPALDGLRRHPVVAVDVNAGHLAVAVVAADGNVTGTPFTVPLDLAGLPASTRDGQLRAAISGLIAIARQHGARAIVIEDLDFAEARAEGRERHGNRPSRGRRGRGFRRAVAGIPTGRLRDRLVQMAANAGLSVVVVDPAYTSKWGAQYWLAPLRQHHPETTGHHAAALVIGRRGLGHRARGSATGNQPAPEEAARPAQARPRTHPAAGPAPRKPATPRGPRQPPGTKTRQPHRTMAGNQAGQDRTGPPDSTDYLLLSRLGTVRLRGWRLVCPSGPGLRSLNRSGLQPLRLAHIGRSRRALQGVAGDLFARSRRRGISMALYMYQASYTAKSMAAQIKEPQDPVEAFRPTLEDLGAKILVAGFPFGEYDVLVVYEAPDDMTAASVAMAVAAAGEVKSGKTTRLLSGQEWLESLRKRRIVNIRKARQPRDRQHQLPELL